MWLMRFYQYVKMITNRGAKIYPEGQKETFCVDHWRVRFVGKKEESITIKHILHLLNVLADADFDLIKTEHLYSFDGKPAYSSSDN